MAPSSAGRLDDPPILAHYQQSGGGVAPFDQLLDDIVRFAAVPGVDGPDASGMSRSLAGGRIPVTDQQDLILCPAAFREGLHQLRDVHPSQVRGQDPRLVQGVHGVDEYLHAGETTLNRCFFAWNRRFQGGSSPWYGFDLKPVGPICGLQQGAGSSLILGFTDYRVRSPIFHGDQDQITAGREHQSDAAPVQEAL